MGSDDEVFRSASPSALETAQLPMSVPVVLWVEEEDKSDWNVKPIIHMHLVLILYSSPPFLLRLASMACWTGFY
jgi:hypothetical protein